MKVNLFLLGAPKCGTTTVYHYLRRHCGVCGSDPKEPVFFESTEYERGIDFYHSKYFPHYADEALVCDCRPSNLYLSGVHERIFDYNPEAKLVVCLRDPVKRAFSHWWMRYSRGRENLSFREACERNIEQYQQTGATDLATWNRNLISGTGLSSLRTYVDMGHYAEQLNRFLGQFPRKQLFLIFDDDLRANEQGQVARLFDFVGLPSEIPSIESRERNIAYGGYSRWLHRLREVEAIRQLTPVSLRRWLLNVASTKGQRPELDESTKEWLYDYYEAHDRSLAEICGSELPWRKSLLSC